MVDESGITEILNRFKKRALENIYLDTSIFVKENFLEGTRIKSFLKLFAEGQFQLVMSSIAINEIKNQFKKTAKAATLAHNTLLNDRVMAPLRNIPESEVRSTKFPPVSSLCNSFNGLLDIELTKANVIILEYPVMDVREIFDDYFNSRFPFNIGEKKSEFPDAFALNSLINWCKTNDEKCVVFSKDNDFLKFENDTLDIRKNYEEFLDEYLKLQSGRIVILDQLVKDNDSRINKNIRSWLTSQLDDISLYYDHSNNLDIHDISIYKIDIADKSYTVTSVEGDQILIEMKVDVFIEIELVIDDEELGHYDSEDREWSYYDTTTKTIEQEATIPLAIVFYIKSAEDYDKDCDVLEINDGNKFKVRRPKYDR